MGCVGAPYTDEQLVELYKTSQTLEEAKIYLEDLFARYENRVIVWCLRITGRREEASDLAQDVFLKVFRGLNDFKGESTFYRWLYQIARNHCINFLHRSKQTSTDQLEESTLLTLDGTRGKGISEEVERKEILNAFSKIVEKELDLLERKVLYLHFADGMQLPEITKMLNLNNKSGAKAYLVSAKRKIQRRMEGWLRSRRINVSQIF